MRAFLLLAFFPSLGIAAESVKLGNSSAEIVLLETDEGAFLKIVLPDGKIQNEEGIGQEFVPMLFAGEERQLIAIDLDKDGNEEFFVRGLVPPQAGAVLVYRYQRGSFSPMAFASEGFLLVDATAPVRVNKEGGIQADILQKVSGKTKVEKLNWAFENGKFLEKK